ncbi:MAG: CPBP family intramembrane metalloprotease [Chlorobi bacterium]|nr:CPBP family intramembrane metalloprotease [Chlorobiota bacterium]
MNHLECAFKGKNNWWRYLVMFFIVFFAANTFGALPFFIYAAYKVGVSGAGFSAESFDIQSLSSMGVDKNVMLLLLMLPFVVSLITFIILIKPLNGRTFYEVVNGTSGIRWNRFVSGFISWGIIMALYLAFDYFMHPENFEIEFSVERFIPLVLISVILIPVQTSFEETMFRGYLTQGVAVWTRNRIAALVIPAFLFGLMHIANPEIKEYGFWLTMPQYIIFGLVFGFTTILDDGIELAMGAHAANNIFLSIFVTFKASALPTYALFVQKELDPKKELISMFIISVLFVIFMYRRYNWDFRTLLKPLPKP